MSKEAIRTGIPSGQQSDRSLSQLVFVTIALGIILAGIWTLYMSDAPYHPDDTVSRGDITLAAD